MPSDKRAQKSGQPPRHPVNGIALAPVALAPVALAPVALGPVALGPVALGPVALGPVALGPVALGIAVGLLLAAALVPAAQPVHGASQDAPAPNTPQFYTARVQPILQANCYRCHAGLNHRGGLQLDTRAGMLRGGHDGAVLVPGHPEQSLLIRLIRHEGPANDPMPMPPKGKLSDADIATVAQWISAGAAMPPDPPLQ